MKPAGRQLPVEVGALRYNGRDPEPPGEVKPCMPMLKRRRNLPSQSPEGQGLATKPWSWTLQGVKDAKMLSSHGLF